MTTTPAPDPPLVELLDPARIVRGAKASIGGGPWGTVAEILSGAWPSPTTRIWIDYRTHVECYTRPRDAGPDTSSKMILPDPTGS